jgi:hypothetical protein
VLKVIGSGLGRTGTHSTKTALEMLGFGPCHHMFEVFQDQDRQIPLWIAAGQGRPDWDAIFQGFVSQIDHPGAQYYAQLAAKYPQAKVLHTVRDPDKWFDSTQATIFNPASMVFHAPGDMGTFFRTLSDWYGGDLHDRAFMTDFFRRHTEQVKATIPAERLLVWEVAEGWAPLCAFLGVPVPDQPIPHTNSTEEFQARVAAREAAGAQT